MTLDASFEAGLQNDVMCLQNYVAAVQSGVDQTIALETTMATASEAARAYAVNMDLSAAAILKFQESQMQSQITAQAQNKSLISAKTLMTEYNNGCKNVGVSQASFIQAVSSGNSALGKYLSGLNGAKASMGGYIASLVGAKAASIALQVATMAMNMAITMGISVLVTGLMSAISHVINAEKEMKERAEEATQSFKEQHSTLMSNQSDFDALSQKYGRLSKGVNALGQNVSLSAEEYEEYQSVVQRVADYIPSLVQGYDEQGNAILSCKGNVEELTKAYNDLIIAENNSLLMSGKDVFKSFKKDYKDAVESNFKGNEMTVAASDALKNILNSNDLSAAVDQYARTGTSNMVQIVQALKDAGLEQRDNSHWYAPWTWGDAESGRDFIVRACKENKEVVQAIVGDFNQQVEANTEGMDSIVTAYLSNAIMGDYSHLKGTMSDVITQITSGFDAKFYSQFDNVNDLYAYLKSMLDDFSSLSEEDSKKIQDAFDIQAKFNNGGASLEEYVTAIKNAKAALSGLSEENKNAVEIKLGLDTADVETQYNDLITNLKAKGVSEDIAKQFANGLSSSNFQAAQKLFADNTLQLTDTTLEGLNTILAAQAEVQQNMKQMSFADLMDDEGFNKFIDGYVDKMETLKSALDKINDGKFEQSDMIKLFKDFPELANHTDNLSGAIRELVSSMSSDVVSDFSSQFGNIEMESEDDRIALENFMDTVVELGQVVGNTQFAIDIDAEIQGMENLWKAMKESVSSTGLTSESVKNLKSRYQDLENYDAARLFEKTTNGIHLNTKALRELESAYEKQKKTDIDNSLQDLVNQYNSLTTEIDKTSDTAKRAELYAKRSDIQAQIEDTAMLAAQYEGLTSAFYKWEQAQSIGEEGDMYDSLSSSLKDIKQLYDDGLIGTNKFRTAVQLMSNQDLSTASIDELLAAYDAGYSKMTRYFQDSSDGCLNFLHDVEKLNSEWVSMNSDGSWNIDFGVGDDQKIADALGINVEAVQSIMRKLSDYGFDINLDSMYTSLDLLKSSAEEANQALIEMGKTKITFDFDSTNLKEITEQIPKAQELLDTFKNTDGTVNMTLEGATEAQEVLVALISQKQQLSAPSVMNVDTTNADSNITTTIGLLKDFQTNYNDIEIETAVGADTTQAQTNIQAVLGQIESMPDEVKTSLGLDDTSFQTALTTLTSTNVDVKAGVNLDATALETVKATISGISPEMMVKAGLDSSLIDGYVPNDKEATVTYNVDDSNVRKYSAPTKTGTVTYYAHINSWTVPTRYGTVIYTAKVSGSGRFEGTAHANGTAFKSGDWGTKKSETALVGEQGQELIVYGNRYWTVGDDSAEFANIPKGSIVFNAEQTKQILTNGKITQGQKRGTAHVNGTAFVEGTAYSNGVGKITGGGSVKTTPSGSGGKGSGGKSKKSSDNFEETFDWIEVAIDRIERAISKLDTKASSVYRAWSERNKNLTSEMSKVSEEIKLQQAGYTRYMQQANSVGLSTEWMNKVKNGLIDINTITDEGLADKIKEAQEWVDKAKDCEDAVVELQEKLSELYQTAFDNVAAQYDGILGVIKHEQSMIEEYISQAENKGYLVSVKYYEALMAQEKQNISQLQKEKADQLQKMTEAVNSGTIARNSEAWYEMVNAIDETTLAIEEGTTKLTEYAQAIREIKWEMFDLLQEKISAVTTEAEFMIDLLSSSDMYTDKGQLTSEGQSTMGLHAVNYNVYMAQADKYAQEMQEISKQLADDPANEELAKRRQELLELQQDMILAAEDEKEAIVDMVREGIELELDSLQDLIDRYNDAIDAQKDLYSWQKKIKDQTSEVATLQKQLQAYSGDTSEETKATIQKIKVSLEKAQDNLAESEYDKYISDQKALLDELYLDYETTLNMRLDNIDALISDMINSVNDNSSEIASTLYNAVDKVGYTMSAAMDDIWKQAYANTQSESALRVQQMTSVLNQLVANGSLTQYEANQLLTALGNGDAQQAAQVLSIIQEMVNSGSITTATGNSIISSLNTNSVKATSDSLKVIQQLVANGTLSQADANKIVTALVTGSNADKTNAANIISRLLANSNIDTSNAVSLLTALNGNTASENANTLNIINRLLQNANLSTADATKLWNALITGNAQDLADTTSIITRLLTNSQISSAEAANLIATLNGAKAADLQNALSIVNKLTQNGTLSQADANKIVQALITGDAGAVTNANSIISKLEAQGKLSTADANSLKTALNTSLTNAQSANTNIVTTYGKDLGSKITTVNASLANIKNSVDAILAKLNGEAEKKTSTPTSSNNTPTPAPKPTPAPTPAPKPTPAPAPKPSTPSRTKKQKYGVALAIWNGNYGWGTGDTRKKRLKAKGFDPTEIQNIVNKMGKDGYVKSGAWVGKYEGIRDLAPYHYNKFAQGVHKLNRSQYAITQEKGKEFINSPSQGMLTPLTQGSDVFNASASQNLWDMANNPEQFLQDNLGLNNIPTTVQNVGGNNFTGDMNIEINLEGVTNYEEFIYKFQHDSRFEKLVRSMTVDKMFGGNSLKKYKV